MSYQDTTYIIFDGDSDKWAYARMKGWKALENIDFHFENAHDEYSLTSLASNEDYVKGKLKKRFSTAKQVIVLIGDKTKYLYKYVRWELEISQELKLPIIAVNLNGDRIQNDKTCPPIIKDTLVVHIPFRLKIIKYALDNFPPFFDRRENKISIGGAIYPDSLYKSLGLNENK